MKLKAFTLLEVLIYIALFTLLMTGLFVSAVSIQSTSERTKASARIFDEALYLFNRLDYEIETADSVAVRDTAQGDQLVLTYKDNVVSTYAREAALVQERSGVVEPISDSGVRIASVVFEQFPASTLPAYVKIHLTLVASAGTISLTKTVTHESYSSL